MVKTVVILKTRIMVRTVQNYERRAYILENILSGPKHGERLFTAVIRFIGIGAGRILKVEGHSGGSNYFGAKRRKKSLVPPTFQLCPPSF